MAQTDCTSRFRVMFPAPWYEAPREGIIPPYERIRGYLACKDPAVVATEARTGIKPYETCTLHTPCRVTKEQMIRDVAQKPVVFFPVLSENEFPTDYTNGWTDLPDNWSGW